MPVIYFAACVLSVCGQIYWWHWFTCLLWSVYDSKENTHVVVSGQTRAWQLIVLDGKQSCGTYNPISGLTVVAHWPADSPGQRRHNPKEEAAKGRAAVWEADLPKLVTQLWDSELASKVCFDRLSSTTPTPAQHPSIRAAVCPRAGHVCTSTVSLWQLEANKRWKAERHILTVNRKHGRHKRAGEAQRPRPQSQHTLPATCHRLPQGLFSSSKHSGWKTPECSGSVIDYNRGKRGWEPSTSGLSQTKSSSKQKNGILQGTEPLNYTIILLFHKWTSPPLHLTWSIPWPSSSMVPSQVMWSFVSWACELKHKKIIVFQLSTTVEKMDLCLFAYTGFSRLQGFLAENNCHTATTNRDKIFLWLQCQYTTPFPIRRCSQSFSCECYKSCRLWKAQKGGEKGQYCILLYINNKVLLQDMKIKPEHLLSSVRLLK